MTPRPASARWIDGAVAVLLVAAVAAVYRPVAGFEFVAVDDPGYVTQNPHVRTGLSAGNIAWAFTRTAEGNWHPLTWLSHMLDVSLFGLHPGPHHLTSLLFHAANTVLVFLVLRRFTGARWPSAVVAGLFALHPLHVESVAWVAERKDVLSTFFWLLTMAAYARYAARPSLRRYVPVFIFLALGLMAKPMLVTLPLVLLLLDVWPLGRISWFRASASGATGGLSAHGGPGSTGGQAASGTRDAKNAERGGSPHPPRRTEATSSAVGAGTHRAATGLILLEKLPLLALAAASCVITYFAQQGSGAVMSLQMCPFSLRLANAMVSYVAYLKMTIWPHDLALLYAFPFNLDLRLGWAAAGGLAVVTALVVWQIRRRPYLAVGWFWFLGTLAPVIGLVQIGAQARADRYTYVPLIGLFIMAVWGAADVLSGWRYRRLVLVPAAAVVLAACGAGAARQVPVWEDTERLFSHAISVGAESALAHLHLGMVQRDRGDRRLAIEEFRLAANSNPQFAAAWRELGSTLMDEGRFAEALAPLSTVVQLDPNWPDARANLGVALMRVGRPQEGVEELQAAARLAPADPRIALNLGLALHAAGRVPEAVEQYRRVLQIDPGSASAHMTLGMALIDANRADEALPHLREAIRLKPPSADGLAQLAAGLLRCPTLSPEAAAEAVRLAAQACELSRRQHPIHLDTLAVAYARAGRLADAVTAAREAVARADDSGRSDLAAAIRVRLKTYQAALAALQGPQTP
jgi:protein O-mannosyl-transferase